jgi:hypothetical protein
MSLVFELELASSTKFVLLVLADHADDEGRNSYPSASTIARKTSLGESTVRSCLRFLRSKGFIRIERHAGQHRPTTYQLLSRPSELRGPDSRGPESSTKSAQTSNNDRPDLQNLDPNHPEPSLKENRPSSAKPAPSEEAVGLACLLRERILQNNPEARIKDRGWATEADRILRLDRRGGQEARELIAWCQQDQFWMTNILSMETFRKKYDQLKLKMRNSGTRKGDDFDERFARAAKKSAV